MIDLKPCPFCGVEVEEHGGLCNYGKHIMTLDLKCKGCGTTFKFKAKWSSDPYNETYEAWNRRKNNDWNAGWEVGYNKARAEYGMLRDGEATMEPATKSQMEEYGDDLVGWCSRCEKPINGRWAGLVSFCPWCGRPMRWGLEE